MQTYQEGLPGELESFQLAGRLALLAFYRARGASRLRVPEWEQ